MVKKYKYDICRSIKIARHKYRIKWEEQFSVSEARYMWQGLLTITYYKKKASHVADTNAALPDERGEKISRLEHNDSELLRIAPEENEGYVFIVSMEDYASHSSVLTLARPPRR